MSSEETTTIQVRKSQREQLENYGSSMKEAVGTLLDRVEDVQFTPAEEERIREIAREECGD